MRYANKEQSAVIVDGKIVPRTHRLWQTLKIYEAEIRGDIAPYVEELIPEDMDAAKAEEERAWRDEELHKADIELYITQDGRGTRSVSEIRDWRNELRDYPEHELFPWGPRPPYSV